MPNYENVDAAAQTSFDARERRALLSGIVSGIKPWLARVESERDTYDAALAARVARESKRQQAAIWLDVISRSLTTQLFELYGAEDGDEFIDMMVYQTEIDRRAASAFVRRGKLPGASVLHRVVTLSGAQLVMEARPIGNICNGGYKLVVPHDADARESAAQLARIALQAYAGKMDPGTKASHRAQRESRRQRISLLTLQMILRQCGCRLYLSILPL